MGLLFLCITIITIVPLSYGDEYYCTLWVKKTNNTVPALLNLIFDNIREDMSVGTKDDKSNIDDYDRGAQDEDVEWHFTQLVVTNGYQVDHHEVTTSDGYQLGLFRIPGRGKVVFLMHDLFGSSDDFVTPGKGHALVYELASAGYDLWFGNARGNVHSRRHENLMTQCKEFWDFSWDDIGRKDLPAMIDYVLEKTNQKSLQYIGYSQGATAFFVMCSEMPDYNKKISTMIALAPVAWVSNATNPLFKAVGLFTVLYPNNASTVFGNIYGYELLSRSYANQIKNIACRKPNSAKIFCNNIVTLAFGFDYSQVNASYLPRVYAHNPAGISAKQLLHYGQGVISGKFRQYDYGREENLKKYGSLSPPDYHVERITTRVVIIQAENDNTATNKDVDILVSKLPYFRIFDYYKIPLKSFGHFDFIVANDVKTLVHDKVLKYLNPN